jgi:hypothetical protein
MNPEFRKVALIAAVLGLAVALFVALRPNDDEGPAATTATEAATTAATATEAATTEAATTAPAEPTTIAIVVQGGRPLGGIQRVSVRRASRPCSSSPPTSPTRSTSTATT